MEKDVILWRDLFDTAKSLAQTVSEKGLSIASAESCTGGMISDALTEIPGISDWFLCGVIAYTNRAKVSLLGVSPKTLNDHGAVSFAVASEMCSGMIKISDADFALSTTGVAGPDGGSIKTPVGTVCFGWQKRDREPVLEELQFKGDRHTVKLLASIHALRKSSEILHLLGNS